MHTLHRARQIMQVASVRGSGYEWAQHLFMARDAGLSDEEISRIAYGPTAPFWGELDGPILSAVDELTVDATLSQSAWNSLATELDSQQILDLIFTVGAYDTLARMFKALELDIDDDVRELMARTQHPR